MQRSQWSWSGLLLLLLFGGLASHSAGADDPATATNNNGVPGDDLVTTQPPWLMNVAVNRADGNYAHGERLSVRFKSERDAHVYVLYHQADNSTVLIFPNSAQTNNRVKAAEEINIPKADDPFRFRIAAPYGQEAMQVIASKQPIPLLDSLSSQASRAVAVPADTLTQLAATIKQAPGEFAEHRAVIRTRPGGGPLPPPRAPQRFALCVGVDLLQSEEFGESTPIARASAELMLQAFTTHSGMTPEQTKLLVGEQATSAAFEAAMTKWLPSVSQPGDTVFLFYCGHGGQIPALDDSEPDGLDEVLSTYDMDSDRVRETAVSDDRLARWLQELPGRQIVLLMETCHGGGVVDARGMAGALHEEANRCHDISQMNTVVVCACLPDEFSFFAKKSPTAFMPMLFEQAMRELPKPVSVQAAFAFYRAKLPDLLEDDNLGAGVPGAIQLPTLTDRALLPVVLAPAVADPSP
ncbi:MAG: DUF4384 domain-containing protein [Planctomycetaceae bacterium]|nr:DUF4384 domain-containing protein [Planctomycetaceae bacterium]